MTHTSPTNIRLTCAKNEKKMNYQVAAEFDGSPKHALLSSLAVFLAVKFTVRLPASFSSTFFPALPSCFHEVLAANETLFHVHTLLERYLARKAVLKWLSLEPTFPTLQELARSASCGGDTLVKPRDFLFDGLGVLDGEEVVSFDHCKTTLGQRRLWKELHQKDGFGPFWMLLRQAAEPDEVLSVDWLEMAFNFADHWWVSKLLDSGQFQIYDGMLTKLTSRILGYSPGRTKIEERDVFALPSWNKCSWPNGHVLSEFLNRTSEAQFHRMIPLLLRESSGFGFGSPDIFSLLLSKASVECLQTCAEDLLARLIRDSFHRQSVQRFCEADLSTQSELFWTSPSIVTCFDSSFVDAQKRKLESFVAVAIKFGLRVDWDACLEFCCQFGDVSRARIILCVLGDIPQLNTSRFVAASLRQVKEDRKASFFNLFGRNYFQNIWFFRELFHFLSPVSVFSHLFVALRVEMSDGFRTIMIGLFSLSFYFGAVSVVMRMLGLSGCLPLFFAFLSCAIPVALNAYALLILKCSFYWPLWALCCVYAMLLWWQSRVRVSSRSGQYWLEHGMMIFDHELRFLPLQTVSTNQRIVVAALSVFLCVEVWCQSGLYAAAILLLASLVSVANCARAFVNYYKPVVMKLCNIYLAGFCSLFLSSVGLCSWSLFKISFGPYNNTWIRAEVASFLVSDLFVANVFLEKWMAQKNKRRKARGAKNIAQIM